MGEDLRIDAFEREPLAFLDRAFAHGDAALRLPGHQVFVAEANAAREVLVNRAGLYEAHSDFFHTRRGYLEPRELQESIGRGARALLDARRIAASPELPTTVERELSRHQTWPDAGNWLAFRHLGPALAAPSLCPELLPLLDEIVRRAVLAGARDRVSRVRRAWFRWRALRALRRTIEQRAERPEAPAEDVLDVLARAAISSRAKTNDLAEVFVSFLFATAGSVGFVLGWALYLMGNHPKTTAPSAWIVREALRLWPVAWLLGRRPAREHQVGGEQVTPHDEVVVCPYAVHRNPVHWQDPHSFHPERWGAPRDPEAFLPFGWGPHRCVAGSLSIQWVEEVLTILRERYELQFTFFDHRPSIGAALAPPRFDLALTPKRSAEERERR